MISTLVVISALFLGQTPDLATLFESHIYYYTGGDYDDEPFQYRLFKPQPLKLGRKYPLVIWLHGHGEAGSDSRSSLRWLELMIDPAHANKYPFFVLVVQCPSDNPDWFYKSSAKSSDWDEDMITVAVQILRSTTQEYPIDDNCIYLAGISGGGDGCWEMAVRYPQLFAAVVPMSSGGGNITRIAALKTTPIWAFHNLDDTATLPSGDQATVAAISAAGGNVYLTTPSAPDYKHDSWTAAFRVYDVMSWMLAQRRGTLSLSMPAGCRPWHWRHVLAMPTALLATVWLVWLRVNRRLRKQSTIRREADFVLSLPDEV